MNIAIVGSRDYPHLDRVFQYVQSLPDNTHIVSGGARGVDRVAVATAKVMCLPNTVFPANWKRDGKSAGYKRNPHIVNFADELVAFWDGKSKGTANSIELAHKKGIPVMIIGLES